MDRRFTLKNIFFALYRRIWLVIILAMIGGIIGFAYSTYYIAPQYASNVTFVVTSTSGDSTAELPEGEDIRDITTSDQVSATQLINTYEKILTSRSVCQDIEAAVIGYTKKDYTYSQISKMIRISQVGDSQIMKLTITCGDAEDAQIIADAYYENAAQLIRDKFTGGYVTPLDDATLNYSRVAPSRTLYTLVCGIIVGLFSVVIIVIVALLDKRIKTEEDIAALCTIPVIGTIPHTEH